MRRIGTPRELWQNLRQHLIDFPEGKGFFKEGTVFPIEGSSAGVAFRTAKAVILNNLSEVCANWNSEALAVFSSIVRNEETRSGCFLPLLSESRPIGVLQLISRRESAFAKQDVKFLDQVANQIALALKNALEYEEVAEANDRLAEADARSRNESLALREQIERDSMFEDIVGSSEPLRRVLSQVRKVAPSDSTILILGETGTGKELIARAIHKRSSRAKQASGPPEPERPGHDQHRARERSQHGAGPHRVSRCERVISGACDRARERCAHRDEQQKKPSEHRAGGGLSILVEPHLQISTKFKADWY